MAYSTPGQPIGLMIHQHTRQAGRPGIRCEVTDGSPKLPRAEPAQPESDRRRGLGVVAALAADSGFALRPRGKTAWFTFTTPDGTTRFARIAKLESRSRRLTRQTADPEGTMDMTTSKTVALSKLSVRRTCRE